MFTALALGAISLCASSALAIPRQHAEMQSTPRSANDLVDVRISSDALRIGPGESFHLYVEFTIEPDWHIYWKNPGETGAPTVLDVQGPDFEIGEPIFSRPHRIEAPDGVTYGYQARAVVAIPVTAPKNTNDGHVRFLVDINYLVCKRMCLMGRPHVEIDIDTSAAPTGHAASLEDLGESLKVSFPKPLKDLEKATADFDGKTLTVIAPTQEEDEKATFFPLEMPGVTFGEMRLVYRDHMVHIMVPVEVKPANGLGKDMRVAGLIAFGEEQTKSCYEFDLPAIVSDAPQADFAKN